MNEIEMIERFIEQMKQSLKENIFKRITVRRTDQTAFEGILIYSDMFNHDYIIVDIYQKVRWLECAVTTCQLDAGGVKFAV